MLSPPRVWTPFHACRSRSAQGTQEDEPVSRRALVLFVVMCVIWGIPYLLIKVAVSGMTPASLVFLRTGIGALLLVPVAIARREVRPVLPAWRWLIAYTVAELAIPWFLLSSAETRLSSSLSGLLVAAVPLFGALLAWATRSEHQLDGRRLAGLGVGLAGVAVLLGFDVSVHDLRCGRRDRAVHGRLRGRADDHLPQAVPPPLRRRGGGVADLRGGGLRAARDRPAGRQPSHGARASPPRPPWAWSCTAVAFVLFFALIAEIGPVRATVITYFNPAVALVLGVTILGEPLRIGAVLGFALILARSPNLATRRHPAAAAPLPAARDPVAGGIEAATPS